MAALTFLVLLCVSFLASASEVSENITAEQGQTVTLPCKIPQNSPVIIVEWTRPDLDTEYVLFYRDGQSDPENQYPAFKNRVQLKDDRLQDGDVSLVLKDVTSADKGTYECHVVQKAANRKKRAGSFDTEPVKIINLTVQPQGLSHEQPGDGANKQMPVGLAVGLASAVLVLALASAVGFVIFRKSKASKKPTSFQSSVDEEFELQPL
ncbi:hypothetical protein Q5P01_000021 [Channa striata]|uniref:Ig-like domain-containing protein n=1 Tax=Channa striata TaxID=64152 RepID=A0AA88LEG9_CHASR|nr:hypothetical protein Q5P01_000021 [Channa striata]